MPVKHHPQVSFVRRVPSWKMHVFTSVQVFALAVLWAVKSSKLSLAFPFFLIMMVPIRKQMERIYSPLELRAVSYLCSGHSTEIHLWLINSWMEVNQTTGLKMNQTSMNKHLYLLKPNSKD